MKNTVSTALYHFLNDHGLKGKILLVAVSGGVDSMVLLHGLKNQADRFALKLHVAHIHHGWRSESDDEYEAVSRLCKEWAIGFSGTHLKMSLSDSDAENKARCARRAFFEKIAEQVGAVGCFLAHQKQDLQETVLKRIFEGAHLEHLGGIDPVSKSGKLTLYRPFLTLNKSELYEYAAGYQVLFFEDKTNLDPAFLRGKMRQALLPELERQFGKGIKEALSHYSLESQEMKAYFLKKQEELLEYFECGNLDFIVRFKKKDDLFEVKHGLISLLDRQKIVFSRQIIQDLASSLITSQQPVYFKSGSWEVFASQGVAYFKHLDSKSDFSGLRQETIELLPSWLRKKTRLALNSISI